MCPADNPFPPAKSAGLPVVSVISSLKSHRAPISERQKRATRKHVLNAEKLVVLGHTLATGRCTSLDLAGTKGDDEVGDDGVLGLAGTVRDHDTPAVRLRELGTEGLGELSAEIRDGTWRELTPEWTRRSCRFG